MALINKLNAIGDAIREKTGKTDLLTLDEMPIEIAAIETGGGDSGIPEEAFLVTGNCAYRFTNDGWNWFIEEYGDRITTEEISDMDSMFYFCRTLKEIPFDLNVTKNCKKMTKTFSLCDELTEVPLVKGEFSAPTSNYTGTLDLSYFFNQCAKVRYIPYDYFHNFGGDAFWEASKNYKGNRNSIFMACCSLRQLPDISMLKTTDTSIYSSLYYSFCNTCYVLDEIIDLPVLDKCTYTSNAFNGAFNSCYRVKDIIFETQEDGTPYIVQWKSQTINLSSSLGYVASMSSITGYNSGITTDKQVTDDATYAALKNDADWCSTNIAYSRYNHDSAVNTINSLPDTSAYLATAGGTNTIKFKGDAGSKTDGGAINTLTEAEIAVAAAKGWTVSLV